MARVATKPGLTVLSINNVDPQLRNAFKGLCAINGCTLKEGVQLMMQKAVDAQSLDLLPPDKKK
ncbi:hypothetical protein ES705_19940 [subsurface metagenome]